MKDIGMTCSNIMVKQPIFLLYFPSTVMPFMALQDSLSRLLNRLD